MKIEDLLKKSMRRIIIPTIILLLILPLAYFGYRYFFSSSSSQNTSRENTSNNMPKTSENISMENKTPSAQNSAQENTANTSLTETQSTPSSNPDPTPSSPATPLPIELSPEKTSSGHVFASITTTHCQNSCEAFSGNLPYFEYCQNVCGLSEIKKVSADDCKKEKNLRKDYCLKDAALNQKDTSLCRQITDDNLKKTCISRLTEDILENL